jgi:hypothetical protein
MRLNREFMHMDADVDLVHNQAVDACIQRMKIKLDQMARRLGSAESAWIQQSLQDAFNHLKR